MPTSATFIWSASGRLDPLFGGKHPDNCIPVNLNPSSAVNPIIYPPGQVLGEVLASQGLYGFYSPAATDGTQNAKGILQYRASVLGAPGSAGVISSYGGEHGLAAALNSIPMYKSGEFDLSKIVGLDATALTLLAGRVISGALGVQEIDTIATGTATGGTYGLTIPAQTVGGVAYPAVVVTGLAWNISAANLVIAVNAALLAAGVPAYVTATGGPSGAGGANTVVTFHGAYGQNSLASVSVQTAGLTGGTNSIARSTNGVAPYGIVRFG